jgi:hypothetical protein
MNEKLVTDYLLGKVGNKNEYFLGILLYTVEVK